MYVWFLVLRQLVEQVPLYHNECAAYNSIKAYISSFLEEGSNLSYGDFGILYIKV
jgi:hypothetical protein